MKKAPDPGKGRRWNAGRGEDTDELILVSETHEEHLQVCYPSLAPEVERVKSLEAPAAFSTTPGSVTGRQLRKAGLVTTLCLLCGAEIPVTSILCKTCAEDPKTSGGVTHG
jgi:hypothetical protein